MIPTAFPRVKVCCIMSHDEARLAIHAGASALGFVGKMPSGPGPIDDALIAEIVRTVPPPVATFLLTAEQSAPAIITHHGRVHTTAIQIVDRPFAGTSDELRARLPGVKLVQVVHVTGPRSLDEAVGASSQVDALLLDSGRPDLPVKELGGTGRTHDWHISRTIRETVEVPVFLAGGLTPENVREAIEQVGPFGIDLCSGVRTGGRLDPRKLDAFMRSVRGA